MKSEIIDQGNLETIEWDNSYFKYCEFGGFSIEGEVISSDFISCSFKNIDWYWGLFARANFIDCQFVNCVFSGTSFPDARFVECTFSNCRFLQDNLGAECGFAKSVAYGCKIDGGEGFKSEIRT